MRIIRGLHENGIGYIKLAYVLKHHIITISVGYLIP